MIKTGGVCVETGDYLEAEGEFKTGNNVFVISFGDVWWNSSKDTRNPLPVGKYTITIWNYFGDKFEYMISINIKDLGVISDVNELGYALDLNDLGQPMSKLEKSAASEENKKSAYWLLLIFLGCCAIGGLVGLVENMLL